MVKSDKALGAKVKDFRLNREWTQMQAASFFRVGLSTVIRIEQGKGCSDLTRTKIEKLLAQQQAA